MCEKSLRLSLDDGVMGASHFFLYVHLHITIFLKNEHLYTE